MKNINERCPLSGECERNKCDYVHKEIECLYYFANATPDNCIKDQENIRSAEYDDESAYDDEVSEIVMIQIDKLFPHPDNPRKDVGDVAELAESIKANGVLQNLTVIPGHYSAEGEFEPEGFTVIIGHRRLAAAKLAGIKAVPCYIAFMDIEQQISTMLTENMQRADLTVYEQAKAFQQLSLDLGMSVSEIAEKSGFSETTVRRRTKLADLDENAFKKACDRGATLFDFAELDKLEDPEAKQKCLEAMGTQNFKNVLKTQLEEQSVKRKVAKWIEQLDVFAVRIERTEWVNGDRIAQVGEEEIKLEYVGYYGSWTADTEIEKPADADDVRYFYVLQSSQLSIYKELLVSSEDEEERRKKEEIRNKDDADWDEMRSISRRHKELRRDFVLSFGASKTNLPTILRGLADATAYAAEEGMFENDDLCELLGIPFDDDSGLPDREEYNRLKQEQYERLMLILAYCEFENGDYIERDWNSGKQRYLIGRADNQQLDDLYRFLGELGYEMSDEEKAMQDGTHELFYKGEPDAE